MVTKNIRDLQKSRWNTIHSSYKRTELDYDDWLDLFEDKISACQTPIIDLGCGSGNDTLYLVERGKDVIPCDYSEAAIKNIKKNFPEISRTECFDMADQFPFDDSFTDIIIADLSLHYFSESDTKRILSEIKRVLKPSGLLIFRINSINDINFGAGEGQEIEKHFYRTSDKGYKRFFDNDDIEYFFQDWNIRYLQENTMTRYSKPKRLWRCLAEVKK